MPRFEPNPARRPAIVAGAEKARRVLGWTPTHSSIDEIIESAWRWHGRNSG